MIIFDFDQTLVDTSSVEHLRRARRWREVNARADALSPYPGITELIVSLHELHHDLAILTTSPSMVPESFVRRYSWPIELVIGYHQVSRLKPDPEGLFIALEHYEADAGSSFHVGDKADDTRASHSAGVVSIGAGWGAEDLDSLRASEPDHLFMSVAELNEFLHESLTDT